MMWWKGAVCYDKDWVSGHVHTNRERKRHEAAIRGQHGDEGREAVL